MYDELDRWCRPTDRPTLRFKDVSKRGMKHTGINPDNFERLADDSIGWRLDVRVGVKTGEEKGSQKLEDKIRRKNQRKQFQPFWSTLYNYTVSAEMTAMQGSDC